MQPRVEKKAASQTDQRHKLLDRLDSLVEKNQLAYDNAMKDFRDSFTLNSASFDTNED